MRLTTSLCLCAGLLLVTSPALSADISGTVRMVGCRVAPNEITLRAGMAGLFDPTNPPTGNPSGPALNARISRGPTGLLNFTIPRAEPGQLYGLAIQSTSRSCGKVFWRGPAHGLVLGGAKGVAFEGRAVRTKIEIMSEPVPKRRAQWVGAARMDIFDEASATRRVRVFTDIPNVEAVEVQISTRRFLTQTRTAAAACSSDSLQPGFVVTLNRPVAGPGWTDLGPVNFKEILTSRTPPADDVAPGPRLSPLDLKELRAGAPLYMRAIPLVSGSGGTLVRACNPEVYGFPGWLIISSLGNMVQWQPGVVPLSLTDHLRTGSYRAPTLQPWPKYPFVSSYNGKLGTSACYRVVKPHTILTKKDQYGVEHIVDEYGNWDYFAQAAVAWGGASVGDTLLPGRQFCSYGFYSSDAMKDEGFFDFVVGFVTGLIDAVGSLVNEVSELWNDIQQAVEGVLGDVLSTLGIPCDPDSACRALIATAVDVALASMGLPPSLPNFDQLKEEGLDYLAAQIAEQSGLPPEAIDKAMDLAVEAMTKLDENRGGAGGGLPKWLTMDLGFDPPVLRLVLEQTGSIDLNGYKWAVSVNDSDRLLGGLVDLPSRFPWVDNFTRKLTVPIVLRINRTALPPFPGPSAFGNCGSDDDCNMMANMAAADPYFQGLWYKERWRDAVSSNPCSTHSAFVIYGGYLWAVFETGLLSFPVLNDTSFPNPMPTYFGILDGIVCH